MISSPLLGKPMLEANQLGSLSRKPVIVYLNTNLLLGSPPYYEPFALLTKLLFCSGGANRACALSRNPPEGSWGLRDSSKVWSCAHHPSPARLPFQPPSWSITGVQYRDTMRRKWQMGTHTQGYKLSFQRPLEEVVKSVHQFYLLFKNVHNE